MIKYGQMFFEFKGAGGLIASGLFSEGSMERIRVSASTAYDVLVGKGLLSQAGTLARTVNSGTRALIVTDDTVSPLYAKPVSAQLKSEGYRTDIFSVCPGEGAKTHANWLALLQKAADFGLTRSDLIVAVGGGTVSDLAGFAAACYLRGVSWICIPTTLLAMVDASVGGKTGIDLVQGKNLVGAFYQPGLVLCDPAALDTLPQAHLSDGFAEVIKYGMIGDETLLDLLHEPFFPQAEAVICRCISQKRDLVQQDEFDCGIRRLLNFGHTVGHAIEALSEYRISHGKAVAIGMAAMTKLAEHSGNCADGVYWELYDLLRTYGLPAALPYGAQELWQASCSDKKRQGETLYLVLPMRRGQCRIHPYSMEDYRTMLEAAEAL